MILRMSRVTTLDATGAHVLGDTITRLERRGIAVLLSGLAPEHEAVLTSIGVAGPLRAAGRILPDTPSAIDAAQRLLATTHPPTRGRQNHVLTPPPDHPAGSRPDPRVTTGTP